jgi:hypothetical protein
MRDSEVLPTVSHNTVIWMEKSGMATLQSNILERAKLSFAALHLWAECVNLAGHVA